MTDRREARKSIDLALRIGEMLLVSGAAATDTAATMEAVTRACGLRNVSADVTFNDLTLRHQPNNEEPVTIQVRRVTRRPANYGELVEVDTVVHALVGGTLTRDEARDEVARIVATGPRRRAAAVAIGWGLMGIGVALTLGGTAVVCLLAFLAAVAIDRTRVLLPLERIPLFYQQAAGGFVATLIAVIAAATPLDVNPSRVVSAGIVMLLAGIGITGATQDALTGFPVTATARLLDPLLNTTGVIAGVGAGLTLGGLVTVDLGTFTPGAPGVAAAGITVVGAALAATGFAFASSAPLRSLLAVALVADSVRPSCMRSMPPASVARGEPQPQPSPSVPSATSWQVASACRPSSWSSPRSCHSSPGSTSTVVSPSSPPVRTACSSWPRRSPSHWHSPRGSPSASTLRSRSSARRGAWGPGCLARTWSVRSGAPASAISPEPESRARTGGEPARGRGHPQRASRPPDRPG